MGRHRADEDPLVEEIQRERQKRWPYVILAVLVIVGIAITFAVLSQAR